jgi:hypothetical protein
MPPMRVHLETLEEAAAFVHPAVPSTPRYCWPLLSRRVGAARFARMTIAE